MNGRNVEIVVIGAGRNLWGIKSGPTIIFRTCFVSTLASARQETQQLLMMSRGLEIL